LVPTNTPTLSPTDPKPDEEECADCTAFLSNYKSWQFWTAKKGCNKISKKKKVQKTCKKVVEDVFNDKKNPVDACKNRGWCEEPRARARRTTECVCEGEPTSSPTDAPTGSPVAQPTKAPTKSTPAPTIVQETPPTASPTANPTANPTNRPTANPTLSPTDPLPDDECADCQGFLSNYKPWQFWTAKKGCNKISTKKKVQKTCKKVVEDVFNKEKNPVDACKNRGWC